MSLVSLSNSHALYIPVSMYILNRLPHLSKQVLFLIRCALAIPKTLYLLRTAPCFHSPLLEVFDQELRSLLNLTLNIPFEDHHTWLQETLPVGCGGLGVRRSVQLAPSAFLASAAASSPLIQQLLPGRLTGVSYVPKEDALNLWLQSVDCPPPASPRDRKQQAWDEPQYKATYHTLIESAGNSVSRARLLAANVKESGAWINALPISAVGLRMNDDEVQLATALRLGAPICHPYKCHLCGHDVDQYATHGLSCYRNTGRHFRHAAINNIIHRSLATANIPSRLEPSGLSRSDGKRPDGVTITPWTRGRILIWDATCIDTFAPSYVEEATREAGSVAAIAESRKKKKYEELSTIHEFTPVAIETTGVMGPETMEFIRNLTTRIRSITGEDMAHCHQLAVATQKGNAMSIMSTMN